MRSAFETLNHERMRRERQEAFTREFLRIAPFLAMLVLFFGVAVYALPKAATEVNAIRVEASE